MSVIKGYVTEEDIPQDYLDDLVSKIKPILQEITGKQNALDELILESTILKVLVYINGVILPKALFFTVAEMCARQMSEYDRGLDNSKNEGTIKKVQRGGFTQEFDKATGDVPRGTQFMQDYSKQLNRFRKMRSF